MGVVPNHPFLIGIFHEINIQLYTPPIETSRFGKFPWPPRRCRGCVACGIVRKYISDLPKSRRHVDADIPDMMSHKISCESRQNFNLLSQALCSKTHRTIFVQTNSNHKCIFSPDTKFSHTCLFCCIQFVSAGFESAVMLKYAGYEVLSE